VIQQIQCSVLSPGDCSVLPPAEFNNCSSILF